MKKDLLRNGFTAEQAISSRWQRWSLALALAAFCSGGFAAESIDTLLQKGLFEEEANHNLTEAIKAYEAVIARTDEQRKFAATAVFRLAECYRKLGKTNEANAQYQRVIRDFAEQAHLVQLSRNILGPAAPAQDGATKGRPATAPPPLGPEDGLIQSLAATFRDNPDLINGTGNRSGTPLHSAAQQGQLKVVNFLLTNGANVELRNSSSLTPLLLATKEGHKEVVEALLRVRANPNAADDHGATPAHYAAYNAMRGILEELIKAGADVNAKGEFRQNTYVGSHGSTPLHIAAGQGYRSVAELLLEKKADPNAKNSRGETPLHTAAAFGSDPVVALLLARGAQVNAQDQQEETPLHHAVLKHLSTSRLLLEAGAEVNRPDNNGWPPLFHAVRHYQLDTVQLLLKHKADPKIANARGETALTLAANHANRAVGMLVEAGADVNARAAGAPPVIFSALSPESTDMLRALLGGKPNLDVRDAYGLTPLHRAVDKLNLEGVKLLLEAGADPNAQLGDGTTPLHTAASKGAADIAAVLLAHKADPNIVNRYGRTAFESISAASSPGMPSPGMPPPLAIPPRPVRPADSQPPLELDRFRALLLTHGADTNISRRNAITIGRNDYKVRWFTREGPPPGPANAHNDGRNPHNRFTLFELIASFYDAGSAIQNSPLPFPDLARVRIDRLGTNQELQINVAALLREADCRKDIWLQWGDVVTIPEAEHQLNTSWHGFPMPLVHTLTNCLRRTVHVVIKGQTNDLTLQPHSSAAPSFGFGKAAGAQFWLSKVLYGSALLLSTSDTSRVKVYRTDPITKEQLELEFDLRNSPFPADLWLRNGDVIEVPELAATAEVKDKASAPAPDIPRSRP